MKKLHHNDETIGGYRYDVLLISFLYHFLPLSLSHTHLFHSQKFRLIVRIDEDVKQLREKMQAEALQKVEEFSL